MAPRDTHQWSIDGMVERPAVLHGREGPLGPLLRWAAPRAGATHATVESRSRQFRASIPLDRLVDARLVDGRLFIDDAPTRCWLVKDIARIVVTDGESVDSVGVARREKPLPQTSDRR